MTIQAGEYKSRVGLDNLYYALVTTDSAATYAVGSTTYLAPAAAATQAPSTNIETQYADDQPYDVITSEGATEIVLTVTGIPLETLAAITGKVYDTVNGRMYDTTGTPPYCALGFRALKSDGSYRYYWFLKGMFTMPDENLETKGETPTPQTQEITYSAIQTVHKFNTGGANSYSVKRVTGDTSITAFSATTWFDAVQTPDSVTIISSSVSPSVSASVSPSASTSPS